MYEFLTNIGVQPLVANFIARPEWLHIGTAFLLVVLILSVAYLLRIDLDPFIFGRLEPFESLVERLFFYPVVLAVLWWTYAGKWHWPDVPPQGFYLNKFTIGIGCMLILVVGRAVIHFIRTERDRWDFFDQLPFYLMIEFQFFAPLVSYNQLERNMLMPKEELGFAIACLFLCYFVVRYFIGRPTGVPKNPVGFFLLLFTAYMLLTLILFPYRLAAIKNVIQWIAFAACFLLALAYIPDKRRRDAVLIAVMVTALVCTLWGFWKYFDIPYNVFGHSGGFYPQGEVSAGQAYPWFYKTPSAGRYFLLAGFFANPNYYGEYLALTLFIGLGLLLSSDSLNLRVFLGITLAINSFEMIAVYNRAGWLGIFVGLAFVIFGLFWVRRRELTLRRMSKVGVVARIAGLVILAVALGLLLALRSESFVTFLSEATVTSITNVSRVTLFVTILLACVGLASLVFGLLWESLVVSRRLSKLGFVAGVAGLAIVLVLAGVIFNEREKGVDNPLAQSPWERLKSMTDFTQDETFRNRLTMWRASYLMLVDPATFPKRLIFGGGFGFFEVEYLPYQTEVLETYNFNDWFHNVIPTFRAHNDHLQMLVEAGIVGTTFYALVFIMFFVMGYRFLSEEKDPARKFFALGVMGATASSLASGSFSFPYHQIQAGGLIFTAMGFLIADIALRKQQKRQQAEALAAAAQAPEPFRKKKRKKDQSGPVVAPTAKAVSYEPALYMNVRTKFRPFVVIPLITLAFLLSLWGVYTQVINFKSQYLVVKGIAALRNIDSDTSPERKQYIGQVASDFFWKAYQLDPTNGRAEFFNGFSLIKKNTYQDVVLGTRHLEEGQLLYPQSDTHYALAMGYEARRSLAGELAARMRTETGNYRTQLADAKSDEERAAIQSQIDKLTEQAKKLDEDAVASRGRAIQAYMTAAQYYPVKVEYYKDLLRLLEEEFRYDEIIFWAERALVVDAWLKEKPQIRWQLYLWLGKAHKALGAESIRKDEVKAGIDHFLAAEQAFKDCIKLSSNVYYGYYELGQVYESLGDISKESGNMEDSAKYHELARDNYIQTFNRKGNVRNQAPFDYAYFLLGRIYEKLGDNVRAISYYRQLMTQSLYSPNSETYQKVRTRIHELTGVWEGQEPSGEIVREKVMTDEPG